MPTPFPGMDPYLEDSKIWPDFYHAIAEELKLQLNAQLGANYYATVNIRTVGDAVRIGMPHVTYPDVGVYETLGTISDSAPGLTTVTTVSPSSAPIQRTVLLEEQTRLRSVQIYTVGTDQLVTTIEILSPYNKRYGEGLGEYQTKRKRLLASTVHLLELDLLRGGERPGPEVSDPPLDTDYVLLVNRFSDADRRVSEIWPVSLNEPLPALPVPLLPPDPDVVIDLQAAMARIYPGGAYQKRIDYRRAAPPPPLRPSMALWLEQAHLI